MLIVPAIDLIDGVCVRLIQGDFQQKTVYSADPIQVAQDFVSAGAQRIHVVDLDGARVGKPQNLSVIERIAAAVSVEIEFGGGLRDSDAVAAAFAAGAQRIVLGTAALTHPEWVSELIATYGDQIVVGIDAKDGLVAVGGWLEQTKVPALELAKQMHSLGVKEIIYTDIKRDGMLSGPNYEALKSLGSTGIKIVASGGISSIEDILNLCQLYDYGVYAAIIGKALYTKQIDLAEAIAKVNCCKEGEK